MLKAPGLGSGILLNAGTNELEIIEFVVGGQHFGVNVAKVRQVIRWDPTMLTTLHDASAAIKGIIYHRGKPVTLIDLRCALAIEAPVADESRQLVIVTEFNDTVTAFQIDQINRIHRLSWRQLEPFREILPGLSSYITGSVKIQERLLLILDLEHLMSVLTPAASIHASEGNMSKVAVNKKREQVIIMYAEDSSMIRRMTSEQLRKAGFVHLLLFENGRQAHEKLVALNREAERSGRAITEFVSLVLTDIEMPQMDGLTLCKEIKHEMKHATLPVVIYSSLINDQMAIKCRAVGSSAHISKPRIEQIVSVIDEQCGIAASATV